MDAFAKTSPRKTRRFLWRYAHIKNILTCFSRSQSGGSLSTFYPGRHDLLISIIEFKGKRIGVINCHNTSSSTAIIYDFLTSAFAAVGLQTGGTDSSGQKIKPVDTVVLAGDLNIKHLFLPAYRYAKNITTQKKEILLCYLILKTELVPQNFKDTKRKYEINYLMTSKNLGYKADLVCDLSKGNPSDHPPFGATFNFTGDLVPCEFGFRPENLNCDWLQLKANVTYVIHAREAVPAVLEHRRSLRC